MGLPSGWRPQFRFLLGSQGATHGVARPDFSVGGSEPGQVESASAFRPGFSTWIQVGGLGPAAENGAFLEFVDRRQKAVLRGFGSDLGTLESSGVFFTPTMGRDFALGRGWTARTFVDLGAGYLWASFEPSDPGLWPAPASGARDFRGAHTVGWKAGAGVDLYWSRSSGIVVAGHYQSHSAAIPAFDAGGAELGRVEFDASSWSWMIGAIFSY